MTTAIHDAAANAGLPLASYRFRLTRDDVAAFERLPRELFGREKLFLLGPALIGGVLLGTFQDEIHEAVPVLAAMREQVSTLLLAFVVLVPFSYAASAAMQSVRRWWRISRARLPAGNTLIDTFGDHFTVAQDGWLRAYAWEMVRVIEGRAHVFLCPAPREAVIVPRRAFGSDADMRAFAMFAEVAGRDDDEEF